MNFLKNKTTVGLLSIAIAVLVAFVAVPFVNRATRATKQVLRLTQDVPENMQITADMLTVIEVGNYNLPEGVLDDPAAVVDKFAAIDLLTTDLLVPAKFKDYRSETDEYLYEITDAGLVAVAITVGELQTQVSGKIQEGDIVSVYAVGRDEVTGAYGAILHEELKYLKVESLVNTSGEDVSVSANKLINSIVFSCTEAQAKQLVFLQSTGSLYIVHVGRGADALALHDSYPYNIPDGSTSAGTSTGTLPELTETPAALDPETQPETPLPDGVSEVLPEEANPSIEDLESAFRNDDAGDGGAQLTPDETAGQSGIMLG